MISPEGVRRRAKRVKGKSNASQGAGRYALATESRPASVEDHVAQMDVETVGLLVTSVGAVREREVSIHGEARPRSAYVLSLRSLPLHGEEGLAERASVHAAWGDLSEPEVRPSDAAVFGTLTSDLSAEPIDPRMFAEQFTPADFTLAYAAVYGPFDRFTSMGQALVNDIVGMFQTIERVERKAADDVDALMHVVDVPRFSFARALAGFAGLMLVVTLPANAVSLYRSASSTRDAAEGAGAAAIAELKSADVSSLPSTAESLKRASSKFREADAALTESRTLAVGIASLLPEKYRSARALLEAGDKASQAGRLLALAFEKVFRDPGRRLDERLDVLAAYARGALPLLTDASRAAATVEPETLPESSRDSFAKLSAGLESGVQGVREFAAMADLLSLLAGKTRPRTYLLVFQNQSELRPTGGFMGSVAEVVMDRGAVAKLRVPPGGTYDLKGQLLAHVISPAPLHLINAHWQFQDANWFPDFPTSAAKIRWFWSKSGQPTLDGVVAVNASFMEKLLDITGPIDMPAYGKVIERSNFLIETQSAVEIEYDKEANTPKKFIGDLTDALRERMKTFTSEDWLNVAALVSESLTTKDIQVALTDPSEQEIASRYGWSGEIKDAPGDNLALIEANIAGQKTDTVVQEQTDVHVEIAADGSIIDTVTLTRTHTGTKGELFRGVRNVSYLRAYVPKGSTLIEASGFEPPDAGLFKKPDDDYVPDADIEVIESEAHAAPGKVTVGEEGSRTVFGGWMQLDPGATQKIVLRYRLPFRVQDLHRAIDASPEEPSTSRAAYLLLLTSQSGKANRSVRLTVSPSASWYTAWSRGFSSERGLEWDGTWDRDRVMAALFDAQ